MEEIEVNREKLYISPIAEPLAGEKLENKLYKLTKKFIDLKSVKRGVKEVGKSIRKDMRGLVIFAADVSPVDVLSHLPIQCEKKKIPYIWVRSRLHLGLNADTKRPTSVVMLVAPKEENDTTKKFKKIQKKIKSSLYSSG